MTSKRLLVRASAASALLLFAAPSVAGALRPASRTGERLRYRAAG